MVIYHNFVPQNLFHLESEQEETKHKTYENPNLEPVKFFIFFLQKFYHHVPDAKKEANTQQEQEYSQPFLLEEKR